MLRRSLRNPLVVGHKLFWLLRSELHNRDSLGRYGLLLELYVLNCGPHRDPLSKIHHTGKSFLYFNLFSVHFHCGTFLFIFFDKRAKMKKKNF